MLYVLYILCSYNKARKKIKKIIKENTLVQTHSVRGSTEFIFLIHVETYTYTSIEKQSIYEGSSKPSRKKDKPAI